MRCALLFAVSTLVLASPALGQIEMTAAGGGNVGIGNSPISNARLSVENDVAGMLTTYGIRARAVAGGARIGVYGVSTTSGSTAATGLFGVANGGSDANRGVHGQATSGAGQTAYGVYGSLASGLGLSYAGYFAGDVLVTGTITELSDERFKEDVRPLGGEDGPDGEAILDRVLQLAPVAYRFTEDEQYAHMNLPDGDQFGFLTQDVSRIFPELIGEGRHPTEWIPGEDGELTEVGEEVTYQSMNYIHLIPILVQAIQEQQAEIDELRALVDAFVAGGD